MDLEQQEREWDVPAPTDIPVETPEQVEVEKEEREEVPSGV